MKPIHRLLYPRPVFALLVIAETVTLNAWQANPPKSTAMKACAGSGHGGTAEAAVYNKWLNEDVAYIVDDAERSTFQKLTTDDERACFVAQFWERRNPTPGSAENKFKDEHYRRVAAANKKFTTASGTPGWQTDRGHMYIVYGPPDEIEAHPKAADRRYASEVWAYLAVEGTSGMSFFTFLDKTGRGDFHLAPSNGR